MYGKIKAKLVSLKRVFLPALGVFYVSHSVNRRRQEMASAYDCGDDAAAWISNVISSKAEASTNDNNNKEPEANQRSVRLMYAGEPQHLNRHAHCPPSFTKFTDYKPEDKVRDEMSSH